MAKYVLHGVSGSGKVKSYGTYADELVAKMEIEKLRFWFTKKGWISSAENPYMLLRERLQVSLFIVETDDES